MNNEQQPNQTAEVNHSQEEKKVTIEDIQRLASENEEVSKWLASEKDRHFSKSIETWKQNNLSQLVEQEIKKRYPEETEEKRQLRELQTQLEQLQLDKQRESIRNQAYKQATEKGLPLELLDFFVAENEEQTAQNLGQLEKVWSEAIKGAVESKFKENGREPHKSGHQPPDHLQKQYTQAMQEGNMSLAIAIKRQLAQNQE